MPSTHREMPQAPAQAPALNAAPLKLNTTAEIQAAIAADLARAEELIRDCLTEIPECCFSGKLSLMDRATRLFRLKTGSAGMLLRIKAAEEAAARRQEERRQIAREKNPKTNTGAGDLSFQEYLAIERENYSKTNSPRVRAP